MPFQKGNKLAEGKGRKGYEYEEKQMKRMGRLLNGIFTLGEKIKSGKATDDHYKRFNTLLKLGVKIMDKLHATKQETEIKVEEKILIELGDGKDNED